MFFRGKDTGHDIDLLISHPEHGREEGLLQRLISVLESHDILLQGRRERSTFSAEDCANDVMMMSRHSNLNSTLDHFEKWIGIVKVDARFHCGPAGATEVTENVLGKCQK